MKNGEWKIQDLRDFDIPYLIFEMLDFEEKTLRNKSKVKSHM
jgi:hypothetical protein